MHQLTIGLIREGKVPVDKRVPLSPEQCQRLAKAYPNLKVIVEPSPVRCFSDQEYADAGIELSADMARADILMGVKEVPVAQLIPEKTYLFFSHTFKKQPHNAKLLRSLLDKRIRLIDYEVLKYPDGNRIIGFGRYAGIAGAYSGLRAFGLKHGLYDLKPGFLCKDTAEMKQELQKVALPDGTKLCMTGHGRVAGGTLEILREIGLELLSPEAYLNYAGSKPALVQLDSEHCFRRKSDGRFDKKEFYADPSLYESDFLKYCQTTDLYFTCHYWAAGNPPYITAKTIQDSAWRISVIADISCDVNGPIASTIRSSTIENPYYGFSRKTLQETDPLDKDSIMVIAVDNLPCEIPRDASEGFGEDLLAKVLPLLIEGDRDRIIENATQTTLEGELSPKFSYLSEYAAGAVIS